MNTTIDTKPIKYLQKDADGNFYAIPENEAFAFTMAVEDIQNAEWGSSEWGRLIDDFFVSYNQYRKG